MNERERFISILQRTELTKSGCWEWQGNIQSKGYGTAGAGKKSKSELVHKLVFRNIRDIPDDKAVVHDCFNKLCCNPKHLKLVPRSEALRHWHNGNTKKCKRGHPLSGKNIRIRKDGRRVCRKCQKIYREREKERKKEKAK